MQKGDTSTHSHTFSSKIVLHYFDNFKSYNYSIQKTIQSKALTYYTVNNKNKINFDFSVSINFEIFCFLFYTRIT